jgi:hypothetical protein
LLRTPFPVIAVLTALLAAAVHAQFPFGGAPGGPGGNPMAEMMERIAAGTIEDANPILGYIQVGGPGRGSRIVIADETTAITRMAEIARTELKPGDEIVVTGVPTAVLAEKVQAGPALSIMDLMRALQESAPAGAPAEGQPAPGGAPASPAPGPVAPVPGPALEGGTPTMGPGFPMPGGAPSSSVTLTGQVKTVEPLTLSLPDGSELAVQLPEGAPVFRRADADASAVTLGEAIVAIGQVNPDGYLLATRIYLGESLAMGRMGGRGGRGGGFGGFGGQ